MKSSAWVETMRNAVAQDKRFQNGWSLLERNGKVQVQHSWLEPGGKRRKAAAMLPIKWEGSLIDVLKALDFIHGAMDKGLALTDAAKLYSRRDADGEGAGIDWDSAFQSWKASKVGGAVENGRLFDKNDGSRWRWIRTAMQEKPPQNASQIFEYATLSAKKDEAGNWIPLPQGSQGRRKKVQTVNQFLTHCRDELGFEARWHPPLNYTKFIGVAATPVANRNRKDHITDPQIQALLESLRTNEAGRRWRLALGLLACFGLRPWELNYLEVDGHFLRVTRGKKNQKLAEPRIVVGIDPEGMPGLSQQLLLELSTGTTRLPALGGHHDQTGNRVNEYLSTCPYWVQIKEEAKQAGKTLASYSFRHRWAFAADSRGFNDREASKFMGNNRDTFVKHYGNKADEDELKAAALRVLGLRNSEARYAEAPRQETLL